MAAITTGPKEGSRNAPAAISTPDSCGWANVAPYSPASSRKAASASSGRRNPVRTPPASVRWAMPGSAVFMTIGSPAPEISEFPEISDRARRASAAEEHRKTGAVATPYSCNRSVAGNAGRGPGG